MHVIWAAFRSAEILNAWPWIPAPNDERQQEAGIQGKTLSSDQTLEHLNRTIEEMIEKRISNIFSIIEFLYYKISCLFGPRQVKKCLQTCAKCADSHRIKFP